MNQDLSILTLVTQASLVVQLVMAGLLIVSLTSWTVIFGKVIGLRRVRVLRPKDHEPRFVVIRHVATFHADVDLGKVAA